VAKTPRRRTVVASITLAVVVAVAAVGVGLYAGVAVKEHQETGTWKAPGFADVVKVVAPAHSEPPSKTIYLERASLELAPGDDDAVRGRSSVVRSFHPSGPVKTSGWTGSTSGWKKLVACVTKQFAAFDVVVTDRRPAGDDYIVVAVGGSPGDIGIQDPHDGGMAPYNGRVIPKAIVFAFSKGNGNNPQLTCETVAQEVGHAYGLDHEYLCKDVMTYLSGCGNKTYVDKDAICGEENQRLCRDGARTQNSYQRLLRVLGPAAGK
jgi:hypothetical protein